MTDRLAPGPVYLRPGLFSRSSTTLAGSQTAVEPTIPPHGPSEPQFLNDDPFPTYPNQKVRAHEVRRVKSSVALSTQTLESRASTGLTDPDPIGTSILDDNTTQSAKTKAFLKQALDEAQFFAGGLLSRATESTKHYTVIRHSFALVWYRGPATTVTISILSDTALPPTRTVWLQQKGFSGKTGMAIKAMVGGVDGWINVTPSRSALAAELPSNDERAYQRDLKRFSDKATGRMRKHLARETHILRIPASASDGYYRLVVCAGPSPGKVLCGSPVFRIASMSTDASVIRGAGLRSIPLEVGVKVGSVIATNTVMRYVSPVTGVVGSQLGKYSSKVSSAAKKGVATAYQKHDEQWRSMRRAKYNQLLAADAGLLSGGHLTCTVGAETGPEEPFPVRFTGMVGRGTGRSRERFGIPTANLSGIPDDVKAGFKGVFVGWARVVPRKGTENLFVDWSEAVITVGPLMHAPVNAVRKNKVTVHMLHDFEGVDFYDAKVEVILMAYIRSPELENSAEDAVLDALLQDVIVAVASLRRDHWGYEDALQRLKTVESEKSFSEKLVDVREKVQQQVDRVPLHLAGVRSDSDLLRDEAYGAGGLYIVR